MSPPDVYSGGSIIPATKIGFPKVSAFKSGIRGSSLQLQSCLPLSWRAGGNSVFYALAWEHPEPRRLGTLRSFLDVWSWSPRKSPKTVIKLIDSNIIFSRQLLSLLSFGRFEFNWGLRLYAPQTSFPWYQVTNGSRYAKYRRKFLFGIQWQDYCSGERSQCQRCADCWSWKDLGGNTKAWGDESTLLKFEACALRGSVHVNSLLFIVI